MEQVLDAYEREYNEEYPVISFDERPCQLLEDVIAPTLPRPGVIQKEDYHYKRNGTCCVLMAIEPLTGNRIIETRETRTKKDYKEFFEKISDSYPKAKKITVIQDNLNTHNPSSFYENMDAGAAFELMNRFEMVYTPKKASWLNVIEMEFAALSKQCLDRRIGSIVKLRKESSAWTKKRVKNKIKIKWQFTKEKARDKFKKHYGNVINS
jgi:transposase